MRNPWYKLMSVALAVVAWYFVQGDQVHEAKIKSSIDWTLPPTLTATDPLPTHVVFTVRGTRAATRRAKAASVRLPVDIQDIGIGAHSLEFETFAATGMPAGVEILAYSPSSVRFAVDEVAERKVEVRPVLIGDPELGHAVGTVDLAPTVVEVRGPRALVAALSEVATAPIDISGLSSDRSMVVELDLPRGVERTGQARIEATVEVVAQVERRVLEDVPVHVWGRHDWRPIQEAISVTVEGHPKQLAALDAASTLGLVHLPDPPEGGRYTATYGPEEGVRLRVLLQASEDVRVVRVEPRQILVVRE